MLFGMWLLKTRRDRPRDCRRVVFSDVKIEKSDRIEEEGRFTGGHNDRCAMSESE